MSCLGSTFEHFDSDSGFGGYPCSGCSVYAIEASAGCHASVKRLVHLDARQGSAHSGAGTSLIN
jgi:hypothetical protein